MTPQTPDFAADAAAQRRSAASSSELVPHVERASLIKHELDWHVEQMKLLKDELNVILREKLVRIMDEMGQRKAELADGSKVGIDDFMEVSIPSESKINEAESEEEREELIARRERCLAWLDENGLGGLVSNQVTIDCGKGDNLVTVVMEFVKEQKLSATRKSAIHPATLKKGIKELRDKDAILPPEADFALVVGRTAKITPPKQPK